MTKRLLFSLIILFLFHSNAFSGGLNVNINGQSNSSAGWNVASLGGGTDSGTPNARCYLSSNGTTWAAPQYSAAISFCNAIAAVYDGDIRMIVYGQGSSALNVANTVGFGYWLGASSPSFWAGNQTAVTNSGLTMDLDIYIQGETEGAWQYLPNTYQADLGTLFTQIRTGLGAGVTIIVPGLNGYNPREEWSTIRGQQSAACTADGSAIYVDMTSYGADLHYTADENIAVGAKLADVFLDTISDSTAPSVTISTESPQAINLDSLTVTGTASDAIGVTGCKFRIGSEPDATHGTACTGATSFSCATSGYGYSGGENTLYVECYDAAGNYDSGNSITVNYTPPPQVLKSGGIMLGGIAR